MNTLLLSGIDDCVGSESVLLTLYLFLAPSYTELGANAGYHPIPLRQKESSHFGDLLVLGVAPATRMVYCGCDSSDELIISCNRSFHRGNSTLSSFLVLE